MYEYAWLLGLAVDQAIVRGIFSNCIYIFNTKKGKALGVNQRPWRGHPIQKALNNACFGYPQVIDSYILHDRLSDTEKTSDHAPVILCIAPRARQQQTVGGSEAAK